MNPLQASFAAARAAFFNQKFQDFTSTGSFDPTEAAVARFYSAVDPVISSLISEVETGSVNASLYEDLCRFYTASLPPPPHRSHTTMLYSTLKSLISVLSLLDEDPLPPPLPLRCGCLNCSIGNEGNCTTGGYSRRMYGIPEPPPQPPLLQRHSAVCDGI